MARIPLQISQQRLDTGPVVDYGGVARSPVGQAMEGLGTAVGRVGEREFAAIERRQAMQQELEGFEAQQRFTQFKIAAQGDAEGLAQTVGPSGAGYHDGALQSFDTRAAEFLETVPQGLRPKFDALLQTERDQFGQTAGRAELEQRQTWYRTGLEQAVGRGQEQVYNNPDALDAARQEALREIDASGLSVIEKDEWRTKVEQGLATSLAARVMQENPGALIGSMGVAVPQAAAGGDLVEAMIQTESGGNPNAISPKGAAGLLQVMPATGVEIAGELGDRNFPVNGTEAQQQAYLQREDVSLRYGTHYMNKMLQRYGGDPEAALIAYNGGAARADAWLAAGRDDSVIPPESANYYKKVLGGVTRAAGAISPVIQSHIQVAKAFLGASEGRDAGALSEFIKKATGVNLDPRQTAWCAAWLNAVFQSQGIQGTGRLNARSFLDFGSETSEPTKGDVVVLSRGDPNGWQGHVGIFMGFDGNGNPQILGGNQSQQVSVQSYPKERVLGYRRPPNVSNAAAANERLERLPGGGPTGGLVVTELDPRFAALPFADRLKLASDARTAQQAQQTAAQTAANAEYKLYRDRVELTALTGGISNEDQILFDPTLTDSDKSSLLRTYRGQQREASATDVAVQEFIAGGLTDLNVLDSDQRKTANNVYDVLMRNASSAPAEAQQALTNDFIQRTGIIPDPVAATVRRAPYIDNPQDLSSALDEAGQLQSISPIAFDTMPNGEQLRRDLTSYQSMVNDRGMSSADAAKRIIERRTPEARRNEEILGPQADKIVRDLEVSDVTRDFATGWLGFGQPGGGVDPTTSNALLAEYRESFREEFIRSGGDETEAKAQALRILRQTWGESSVSGDRQLMKYPPEQFYPAVDGGHVYLRDDALGTAASMLAYNEGQALRPSSGRVGTLRPLSPGEYRDNGDGSFSTEVLTTIQDANGQWVNVPSLWRDEKGWVDLGEDEEAIAAALNTYEDGLPKLDRFSTLEDAVAAAESRSQSGGASSETVGRIENVMLRPDAATAADIRAGRAPRYRLFYQFQRDGQTIVDEVPGYWAMPDAAGRSTAQRTGNMEAAQEKRGLMETAQDALDERAAAFGAYQTGQPVPTPRAPPVEMPAMPADPGTAAGINERLQTQRDELFRNADR